MCRTRRTSTTSTSTGAGVTYGDVFLRAEREYSAHNFERADTVMLSPPFRRCGGRVRRPAGCAFLPLLADDQCIKASHLFNLLDARGVISVAERAGYIGRVRSASLREGVLARSLGWLRAETHKCLSFFWNSFREEIPARMQARRCGASSRALVADELRRSTPAPRVRDLSSARAGSPLRAARMSGPKCRQADKLSERGTRAQRAGTGAGRRSCASMARRSETAAPGRRILGRWTRARRRSSGARLDRRRPARRACAQLPWPKSMRWGGTAAIFAWVRPLRRIVCLLDGEVVPFDLRDGADDGHGLASGNLTEGHRFHAPGRLRGYRPRADWKEKLRAHHVIVGCRGTQARHRRRHRRRSAARRSLTVVDDAGAAGRGRRAWSNGRSRCSAASTTNIMDLPPEVMQVSMRVNQRYFAAARRGRRPAAPWFAFVANIDGRRWRRRDHRRQ